MSRSYRLARPRCSGHKSPSSYREWGMFRHAIPAAVASVLVAGAASAKPVPLSPYASAAEVQAAMRAGRTTSEALVRADLARILKLDHAGPRLNAMIALNPHALADARKLDAERRAGHVRGPL